MGRSATTVLAREPRVNRQGRGIGRDPHVEARAGPDDVTPPCELDVPHLHLELARRRRLVSRWVLRGQCEPVHPRAKPASVPLQHTRRALAEAAARSALAVDVQHRVGGLVEPVGNRCPVRATIAVGRDHARPHLDVLDRGRRPVDTDLVGNLERAPLVRERDAQAIEAIGHDSPLPVPAVPAEEHRPRLVPAGQEPFANDRVVRVHDVDRDVILVQQPEPDRHLPSGGVAGRADRRQQPSFEADALNRALLELGALREGKGSGSRREQRDDEHDGCEAGQDSDSRLGRSPGPLVDIDWS